VKNHHIAPAQCLPSTAVLLGEPESLICSFMC
jgi:hypothetical protein